MLWVWACALVGLSAPAARPAAPLRIEPYTLKSYDGRERAAERVRLTVPAGTRDGRVIELAFIRLPADAALRPPVVFLMGGPGIPASAMAPIPPYFTLFARLAAGRDVILLDQRGLGESTPNADCPAHTSAAPADLFETPERLVAVLAATYRSCAAALAPGIHPTDFTIDHVADDVEAIRVALGVPRLDLLAFSFGSRIALEVLARHPDGVGKAVLQGVLGVDTLRQPSLDDGVFRQFAAIGDAQAQARGLAPSAAAAVRTIQARAARASLPLTIRTVSGGTRQVPLGAGMFNAVLIAHLGDPNMQAVLTTAVSEDYALLAGWVQALYQDLEKGGGSLMARAMVCSAASPPARRRHAASAAPAALLGEALDNRLQDRTLCEAVGVPPPEAQRPIASRAAVLLISGTHDPRTPPDRAEVTRRTLAGSEHVVVQNGGHELLPVAEVQDLVLAFLDGDPARPPIILLPPEVHTIEDARRPPRPRR